MRVLGERRGMTLTAAVGGLVSSTAVTIAMAQRSHAAGGRPAIASAAVLASTLMCVRIAVLAGAVSPAVLPRLLPVLTGMALIGGAAAWVVGRGPRHGAAAADGALATPFSVRAALTFAAVYAAVVVGVRAAEAAFGASGLYLASALSAVVSVDAPTIALARLDAAGNAPAAAAGIAIVAVTNTAVKLGIAVGYGAGAFRGRVGVALGVMSLLGLALLRIG